MCPECQRPAPVGIQCVDCVREAAQQRGAVRSHLGFVPRGGPPVITYVLIGLNAAAYILMPLVLGGVRAWQIKWGLFPGAGMGFLGLGQEWYRWITSAFLHFSWWHIGMNMFVLWQFGTQLEPALGRLRYGILYGVSMLGGSAAIVLIAGGGLHGGASGAIFGLIGAYAIVLRRLRLPFQQVAVSAGLWLALGFVIPGVSWEGHLGGVVAGIGTMLLMFRGVDRREAGRTSKNTAV